MNGLEIWKTIKPELEALGYELYKADKDEALKEIDYCPVTILKQGLSCYECCESLWRMGYANSYEPWHTGDNGVVATVLFVPPCDLKQRYKINDKVLRTCDNAIGSVVWINNIAMLLLFGDDGDYVRFGRPDEIDGYELYNGSSSERE
jgi:hypothetical protein